MGLEEIKGPTTAKKQSDLSELEENVDTLTKLVDDVETEFQDLRNLLNNEERGESITSPVVKVGEKPKNRIVELHNRITRNKNVLRHIYSLISDMKEVIGK